jgi:Tol biopolymer transport system component
MDGVYVSSDGHSDGKRVYTGEQEVFNYAAWSPRNCDTETNCRDLALLLSSPEKGMFVERIRDSSAVTHATIGLGGPPFYYSWSPDGSRMLWQRGGSSLDVYDANQDEIVETLPQAPGLIQAPAWSPIDDRLLVGISGEDQTTDLAIVGQGRVTRLVTGLDGLVSFAWSPDGNSIAYRVATADTYGPVTIIDAVSGEEVLSSSSEGAIAFFWSPDSKHLAYIAFTSPPGSLSTQAQLASADASVFRQVTGIAWSIIDLAEGTSRRYGSFTPTNEMIYLLTYFDQFGQSHRFWSPDSRHILYSEITSEGPVISLIDTSNVDSVPFFVTDGVIGVWSFD